MPAATETAITAGESSTSFVTTVVSFFAEGGSFYVHHFLRVFGGHRDLFRAFYLSKSRTNPQPSRLEETIPSSISREI